MTDRPLTFLERLEHRVARTLMRLPPSLLVRLSGKPQVVLQGLTLHPEVQFLLFLRERLGGVALSALPPEEGRRLLRRFDGLVHGFANMIGLSSVCRAAMVEIASMLRQKLAETVSGV